MKTKLIKLQDKFTLVSDEEIKINEMYVNNGVMFYADSEFNEGNNPNNSNPKVTNHNFKIIAGIEELPSIDFSQLSEEELSNITITNVEAVLENNIYLITKIIKDESLLNTGSSPILSSINIKTWIKKV